MNKQTHFIGLGGLGFTVMQYIQNKEADAIYTCVDEDNIPNLSPQIHFIQCEVYSLLKRIKLNFIREEWNDLNLQSDITNSFPLELENIIKGDCHFVLLAELGDLIGTFLIKKLLYLLKNRNVTAICCLPFSWEYPTFEYGNQIKDKLNSLPNFHYFPLDMIREKYGNLTMSKAMQNANEEFYSIYKQVFQKY